MALPFKQTVCLFPLMSHYQAALTLLRTVIAGIHDIIEDIAQKDSQIMRTSNQLFSRLGFNVSGHYVPL